METLQEKIARLLKARLREGATDLETLSNGHVCGDVISSDFNGLSYEERRRWIRGILDESLAPEELILVSTLLTYTPEEWAFEPKVN